MNDNKSLVSAGAPIVSRNKRYIVWFYLLNLAFAWLGGAAFATQTHKVLDHSLYADKLLHGFDLAVLIEMMVRPEFGPFQTSTAAAMVFAVLFSIASLLLMPGVLLGYSSDHRISRDEFFRTCGHNLWRFVRLFVFFAIIAGIIAGILFGIQSALANAADRTNYEWLPYFIQMAGLTVIFLVLTVVRIWFDLAETDVVLRDQRAVRKSVAAEFRTTRRNFGQLVGTYVLIALVALVVLVAGILLWNMIVPPASVFGAFLISQLTLFLLLAVRFWQRASAVAFYVRHAAEPTAEVRMSVVAIPA
jgi:hypothetical protein